MKLKTCPYVCDKCEGKGMIQKYDPKQLREKRESLGVSLRKMARDLGLSASFLSDVELGKRNPNEKIIKYLNN